MAATVLLAVLCTAWVLSLVSSAKQLSHELELVGPSTLEAPFGRGENPEAVPSWALLREAPKEGSSSRLTRLASLLKEVPPLPRGALFDGASARQHRTALLDLGADLAKIFPPGNAVPALKPLEAALEGRGEELLHRTTWVLTARLHLLLTDEAPGEATGDALESCLNLAWYVSGGLRGGDPWTLGSLSQEIRRACLQAIEEAWGRVSWKDATLDRLVRAYHGHLRRSSALPSLMELDQAQWLARIEALHRRFGLSATFVVPDEAAARAALAEYFDSRINAMKMEDAIAAMAAFDRLESAPWTASGLTVALERDWRGLRRGEEELSLREELAMLGFEVERQRQKGSALPDLAWVRNRAAELEPRRMVPSRIQYDARAARIRLSASWPPLGSVPAVFDPLFWRSK